MNDALYDSITELVNQYNDKLKQYGVEVALHRRNAIDDVQKYNHYAKFSILNFLEYKFIGKKAEDKKYLYTKKRYKLLTLHIVPINKSNKYKKDCKSYAFTVHKVWRANLGERPTVWQYNEQKVIKKIENRLNKLLDKAQKSASPDWCKNTLIDTVRYSALVKYKYIKEFCGKSRSFWETLWLCVCVVPFLLFAIIGLICSIIR